MPPLLLRCALFERYPIRGILSLVGRICFGPFSPVTESIHSDPYFSAFVKAWSSRNRINQFKKPFLSDNERQELEKMTDEILDELDAEEKSVK